jgi:peptidoglycan-N-acetylglucosamine deacetylase
MKSSMDKKDTLPVRRTAICLAVALTGLLPGCSTSPTPPAAATASVSTPAPLVKPGIEGQPGTQWSVDKIKATVAPAQVGKVLVPKTWPNGARVAVVISFDTEDEDAQLARNDIELSALSDSQYGSHEGLPRIVATLDRLNIPGSFYTPAVNIILNPQIVPLMQKSGRHEIALHGYIHESVAPLDNGPEELRLLTQADDVLTKATGKKPTGSRTGSWQASAYTLGIEQKLGLAYDSSLMGMDVPYEIMANGKDTGLIELPVSWVLDDYPTLNDRGSEPSPELTYKVFRDEFDIAYREHSFFMLTMHPHVSGRRSREMYLEQLLEYMKSKPGVWFATAEDVVKYLKTAPIDDTWSPAKYTAATPLSASFR